MRLLICLSLCSVLIAGSAIAAQPTTEPPIRCFPTGESPPLAINAPDALLRCSDVLSSMTAPPRSNPKNPVTQPDYPPEAKAAHQTGTVVMLLTVDTNGHVSKAELSKSSGFESLDQAALNEAKNSWQLLPGTVNGTPITMQYKFAVVFKTEDDKPPIPAAN